MPLEIELFYSPYCTRCTAARRRLRALLSGAARDDFTYRERNVLENLERAVELGVTATPALAIASKLVHAGGWRETHLRKLFTTVGTGV